jgi:hypothetical protein
MSSRSAGFLDRDDGVGSSEAPLEMSISFRGNATFRR